MLPDAIGSKRVVRVDVIEILWETLMDGYNVMNPKSFLFNFWGSLHTLRLFCI